MKKLSIILLSLLLPMMVFGAVFGLKPLLDIKPIPNILRNTIHIPETIEKYEKDMDETEWRHDTTIRFEYLPYHSGKAQLENVFADAYLWDGYVLTLGFKFLEYNANQQCTDFVYGLIADSGEFVVASVGTLEYDEYDRLTMFEMVQVLDEDYEGVQRLEIEYFADNSMQINNFSQEDDVIEYLKVEIDLDSQNRMQSQTMYYSEDSENWELDNKIILSYHAQDNSSIEDFIRHISDNFVMILFMENEPIFGMVSEYTSLDWDGQIWRADYKDIYEYDADLMLTERKSYYFDDVDYKDNALAAGWVHYLRDSFTYDDHGNLIQELSEEYYDGEYFESSLAETSFMTFTDNHDLTAEAITPINLNIYPQPFAGNVNIIGESKAGGELKLEIFNLRGQKVRSFNMPSGAKLAWDGKDESGKDLPASVYFLRAGQGSDFKTKKLIKIR